MQLKTTRTRRLLAILLCTALATLPLVGGSPAIAAGPGTTERVSVDSSGAQANDKSEIPSTSGDGRYVAFQSYATNLVADDTNGTSDVFVRDRLTGATERVSVDSSGAQGASTSLEPSISADGRYVAFRSLANNLVAGDTNGELDIFVRDRLTGVTDLVSVDNSGAQANDWSFEPSISTGGRYVAFRSDASNLVSGDTNGTPDIFVRDRLTAVTERVSVVHSSGDQANNYSYEPSISADGRYVAFESYPNNLDGGPSIGARDIYVRDRLTGATERASVDSSGAQALGASSHSSLSADGRYVAFGTTASNLDAADTNGDPDVYVHDRFTGVTERISVDGSGAQANNGGWYPSISADGRYVAFWAVDDLSPGTNADLNGSGDIFVRDRLTDTTERVSVDNNGRVPNNGSVDSSISADGRYVSFSSWATNVVDGDSNGSADIFTRERCLGDPSCDTDVDGYGNAQPAPHYGPANISPLMDNCPSDANPTQTNSDGNFIQFNLPKSFDDLTWPNSDASGDACDTDDDNDGRSDADELAGANCGAFTTPTNSLVRDSDGDRVLDGAECFYATDPNVVNAALAACTIAGDTDADGVSDAREFCYYGTSSGNANTDGDVCSDGKEVASINGDLTVNATDLSQVAQHFGPSTGPNYIVDFDITKDGNINATDLSQIAQRFGAC